MSFLNYLSDVSPFIPRIPARIQILFAILVRRIPGGIVIKRGGFLGRNFILGKILFSRSRPILYSAFQVRRNFQVRMEWVTMKSLAQLMNMISLRSSLSRGRCKGNEKRVNNFRSYVSVSLSSPSCLVRSPFDVEKRARGKGGGLIRDGDKGGGNCL